MSQSRLQCKDNNAVTVNEIMPEALGLAVCWQGRPNEDLSINMNRRSQNAVDTFLSEHNYIYTH